MILPIIGILISIACVRLAFPEPSERQLEVYAAALAMHLIATAIYWLLASTEGFDAQFYFSDPLNWSSRRFGTGSVFMVQFVHALQSFFGGTFFGYFWFFQCFGMIGVALIIRIFGEIARSLMLDVPGSVWWLVLLPGLHLWTVAIGKDAPLFMAVCLSVWGVMRIQTRWPQFAIAILVMVLIRSHIAAIAMLAFVASLLFDRRLAIGVKAFLAAVTAAGLGVVMSAAQSQLNLETLDPQALSAFIQRSQAIGQATAGGDALVALPYPLKLLSLLFRPLFFDVKSVLGLVASVENAILIFIIGGIVVRIRSVMALARDVFFIAYCMLFSSAVVVLLALLNFNVGLGLRQKTMAMPGFLVIWASLSLYRRYLMLADREALTSQSSPSLSA